MKNLVGTLVLCMSLQCAFAAEGPDTASTSKRPIDAVNERMKYFNEHRLEEFLATYKPDVRITKYPDKLLGTGHAHLRKLWAGFFAAKAVEVEVKYQGERDQFVVNEELVKYGAKGQPRREVKYLSVYEVKDGLIQSVMFIEK